MSKIKAPIPHPVHLRLLLDLYLTSGRLYGKEKSLTKGVYREKISELFKRDGILLDKKNKANQLVSLNLFNKLLGSPFQSIEQENTAEGITISILDRIAKKVVAFYNLVEMYKSPNIIPTEGSFWDFFITDVVKIPLYLEESNATYYKYLSDTQQLQVNLFCSRIFKEIVVNQGKVVNYCLYFWDSRLNKIDIACLQIDYSAKQAILKYFKADNLQWADSVHRTDSEGGSFTILNNALHFTLIDENPENKHIRTNMCIGVHHTRHENTAILKGTYITSVDRGHTPVEGAVIIEKKETYMETLEVIRNPHLANKKIFFDLINKRSEFRETAIDTTRDLHSATIYGLLEKIQGSYVFGLLSSKQNTGGKELTIIRGICFIDPTGIVHSKIYGGDEVRGYVNNDVYHNEHTFVISNFYSTGNSQFKYHYTLTTVTESADDNPQVLGLEGVYSGVYEAVPRAGKIMYCKIDGFNSWEDLDQAELDYKRADLSTSNLHIELRGNKYLDKWQTVYNSLLSDGHMITTPRKRSSNLDNIDGSRTIRKKQ